jgi:hypothetical protein
MVQTNQDYLSVGVRINMKPIKENYTQLEMLRTLEYVATLEGVNDIVKAQLAEANAECETLTAQLARAEECLREYADGANWATTDCGAEMVFDIWEDSKRKTINGFDLARAYFAGKEEK